MARWEYPTIKSYRKGGTTAQTGDNAGRLGRLGDTYYRLTLEFPNLSDLPLSELTNANDATLTLNFDEFMYEQSFEAKLRCKNDHAGAYWSSATKIATYLIYGGYTKVKFDMLPLLQEIVKTPSVYYDGFVVYTAEDLPHRTQNINVTSAVLELALAGGMKVKLDGVWKEVIPWVKVDDEWREADAYIKTGGSWKKVTH